jgi:uncharacterized protein (DUF302 family)
LESGHVTQDARRAVANDRHLAGIAGLPMPSNRSAPRDGSDPDLVAGRDSIVTKTSPWSFADTVARLRAVIAARELNVFIEIDHTEQARRVGIALRDTKVFLVGDPLVVAAAIDAAPLAALDLPLRLAVWDDGCRTRVSYTSPAHVAGRYGLSSDITSALNAIDRWTAAAINR